MTYDEVYHWRLGSEALYPGEKAFFVRLETNELVSSGALDNELGAYIGWDAEIIVGEDLSFEMVSSYAGDAGGEPIKGQMPGSLDELLDWAVAAARLHWGRPI